MKIYSDKQFSVIMVKARTEGFKMGFGLCYALAFGLGVLYVAFRNRAFMRTY